MVRGATRSLVIDLALPPRTLSANARPHPFPSNARANANPRTWLSHTRTRPQNPKPTPNPKTLGPKTPGMVRGATRSLVIDLALLLEGQHSYELPETLLGACRWDG
jgi:hypothetical protein